MVFHGLSTWTPTSPPSSEFDRHQVGEPVGAMTHSTPQPNLSTVSSFQADPQGLSQLYS